MSSMWSFSGSDPGPGSLDGGSKGDSNDEPWLLGSDPGEVAITGVCLFFLFGLLWNWKFSVISFRVGTLIY